MCSYGDIRLVGGTENYEGRVEICINDEWGTVCDDSWGDTDAQIVCNQLGYEPQGDPVATLLQANHAKLFVVISVHILCMVNKKSVLLQKPFQVNPTT